MNWRISIVLACAAAVSGQSLLETSGPLTRGGAGPQLESVSIYSAYTSRTIPPGGLFTNALGADESLGASMRFAWRNPGPRGDVTLKYGTSYNGRLVYSEWNAWNHDLSLSAYRKIAPRWSAAFSLSGIATSLDQSLFTPPVLSQVASVPASLDELAAALLAGRFSNDQFASMLTGAPVVESPAMSIIFGSRMLNGSASAALDYAHSGRLNFHFSAGASRTQYRNNAWEQRRGLLPRSTTASVDAGLTYALSPRTHVQADIGTSRIYSTFMDSYLTTTRFGIDRRMSRRWLVQAYAGVGVTTPVTRGWLVPSGPQYIAGGGLGYKAGAHSFLLSAARNYMDAYGLGASYTASVNAGWQWSRPSLPWTLAAGFAEQDLGGAATWNVSAWTAMVACSRRLTRQISLQFAYSYMFNRLEQAALRETLPVHGARVSFIWTPRPAR